MDRYKASVSIAGIFVGIGTILVILQALVGGITAITFSGIYFLPIAIVFNIIILIALIIALLMFPNKKKTLKSIGIILLNIPIAFAYYHLVITYLI